MTSEVRSSPPLARRLVWAAPLFVLLVSVDQWTKAMVLEAPAFNALDCLDRTVRCGGVEISGVFDLSMTWNRGVSFGAFQSEGVMRWALFGLTAAIAIGFAGWLARTGRRLTAFALALVISGAVGNLVDRARFGAVIDFLDFRGLFFPWIFNVADAAITVGACLLLLDQFLAGRRTTS